MRQGHRLADVLLAEDHLGAERAADLQRQHRGALGDRGPPRWRRRENALVNSSSSAPMNDGSEDGAGDLAPVVPGAAAEGLGRLAPLRPQALDGGQEDDEHERDLEVEVDEHQALVPARKPVRRRQVDAELLSQMVTKPCMPNGRDEREGQCRRRRTGRARRTAAVMNRWSMPPGRPVATAYAGCAPNTAPSDRRHGRQHDRVAQAETTCGWARAATLPRRGAVAAAEERPDDHDEGRDEQEDRRCRRRRGRRPAGRPTADGRRRPGALRAGGGVSQRRWPSWPCR